MIIKYSYAGIEFEGYSEGGIRTSVHVPKYKILFDIGGFSHEKTHVENVLVTHGHMDHACGIPFYISQRSLQKLKPPNIYVNEAMYDNTEKILQLYSQIEGFKYEYFLHKTPLDKEFNLGNHYYFKAYKTTHRIPSQGYTIFEKVKKLKEEYSNLSNKEILDLKSQGKSLSLEKGIPTVSFSGDTQIEYILENKDVRESKILFLECTYIDDDRNIERARMWGHIHLDEIIHYANEFKNEKIILMHFSKRYKKNYIKDLVKKKLPKILEDRVDCFLP
jgi:ribonuclease Z